MVASRAGVHVDTIYELVGRKPEMLRELIERAISGTDGAVPAEDRDYVKAIRAEPDPHEKLAIYARAVCDMQPRMAPLYPRVARRIVDRARGPRRLGGDQPTSSHQHAQTRP